MDIGYVSQRDEPLMQDLDPTTAIFGTSSLVGETDDVFPSVTQGQISDNTGFNWYSIECMGMQPEPIEVEGVNGTVSLRTYLSIGTYDIWATCWLWAYTSSKVYGTVSINGTDIIGTFRQNAGIPEYGSGTVIVGASGWIESVFRVITFFGTGTMRRGAIYFRRTS